MLFNTPLFILVFLPLTLLGYFFLQHTLKKANPAKVFLVLASLFFYGYWKKEYLLLIAGSIIFNYLLGRLLLKKQNKLILILGISLNLLLIGIFKYTDFIIQNINRISANPISLLNLMLPLAISFFTFQQIAFLVDSYQGKIKHASFLDYTLFITFFPQLIAGPIVSHNEMVPQFFATDNRKMSGANITRGIFIFSLGLFKKVVIADTFALWANAGFGQADPHFFTAWQASLSYTFQLYFDFSGYSDMAIGLALLFNIHLPINFNSPYKALNIQDFWRRWHITLSRFLSTYVYIPLGGNRKGKYRTYLNLIITFLLGGIWHGAGWTFIIWGLLHGVALVIHRTWRQWNISMPKILAWLLTFLFINGAWVFFRANNIREAMTLFKGMLGLNGFGGLKTILHSFISSLLGHDSIINTRLTISFITVYIVAILIVILKMKNSQEQLSQFTTNRRTLFIASMSFLLAFLSLLSENNTSDFLYFNF